MQRKTFLLLILDGFGIDDDHPSNAIAHAKMPTWRFLWAHYPHTVLDASGAAVGLPVGQMGNSEVGHMTIGAGRRVSQELTRIDEAIATGDFAEYPVIRAAIAQAMHHPIHVMGLLSQGGVHSHENHFFALLKLLAQQGCPRVYVHAFLDGRDVPPKSAQASLKKLMALCAQYPTLQAASISGRYYAMDRDQRWPRTESVYHALTQGYAHYAANDVLDALDQAYARGETDEFVQPTWIADAQAVKDGDAIFFVNFRADRARQLSQAFLEPHFSGFERAQVPKLSAFYSMTMYADTIPSVVVFPAQSLQNGLGAYLSSLGKTQLRIAETEKYAHVTFFFSGGCEKPFPLETRLLIPSPKMATYDLAPAMSVLAVTDLLTEALQGGQFDFIVCNFANPDMLGHTGNFAATVEALEVVDQCLHHITQIAQATGAELLITADHGNADCMFDEKTNQPHTAHTNALVPLLYVGRPARVLHAQGTLADIAPTILSLMTLAAPTEMTGAAMFQVLDS